MAEYEIIIRLIEKEMENQHYNQREFAKAIGCTEATLSRYLNFKTDMPFAVIQRSLYLLGYRIRLIRIMEMKNGF